MFKAFAEDSSWKLPLEKNDLEQALAKTKARIKLGTDIVNKRKQIRNLRFGSGMSDWAEENKRENKLRKELNLLLEKWGAEEGPFRHEFEKDFYDKPKGNFETQYADLKSLKKAIEERLV